MRQTLHLCLKKPLKERLTDIGAARLMLEGAFETTAVPATASAAIAHTTWRRAVLFLLTAIAAVVLGGLGVWRLMPARGPGPQPVLRFALPSSASIVPRGAGTGRHALAISPKDASSYQADNKLHLRALDRLDDATA